jgi:hypothetical protein
VPAAPAPGPAEQPKPPPSLPAQDADAHAGREAVAKLLPAGLADRGGWAADIYTAFDALSLAPSAGNVCATLAVIEQESTYNADPEVPGLSRIAWREIERRRERYGIPRIALDAALARSSRDGRSYRARIDALRTERQMSVLFEDMMSEFPYGEHLFARYNPVRTGGPMQVSVEFAERQVRDRPYPYPRPGSVRHEVFGRRGGLYFGIAYLLDYPAPYDEALYRFADFNAGRYSARNAAFQHALTRGGAARRLALDGDLLRYDASGEPVSAPSETQRAAERLAGRLNLSQAEILRDLRQEKSPTFHQTPLYRRVFALARQASGEELPRAVMPKIDLKSPKIRRKLTTEWFARRVEARYRGCLARAGEPGAQKKGG